jgi:DNA helicase-2/ATP-dependent DNA helicase PcrA
LYRRYQEALQEQNALDFDDLLVLMLRVFDAAPDVLAAYQQRFRHVLVDEYQDVNKAQYLLVSKLAAQHRNLTIVGDDSQAIYGWRGADVRYILKFEEDFPECKVVRLEQNYRSTKTILEAAQAVEAGLGSRHEKQLWTDNPQGGPIILCQAIDEHDEATFVAREIERLVSSEQVRYGDVAVMYRMNAQSRALEEAFVKRRLPYQLVGGTRFYERREIKDVLAYLRLVNNPMDAVSLERIVNVPNRGVGEKTLQDLRDWASRLGIPIAHALRHLRQLEDGADGRGGEATGVHLPTVPAPFTGRPRSQLLAFAKLLDDLGDTARRQGIVDLFDTILLRTGYREFLAADKNGEERWENVMELRTVVSQYAGLQPGQGLRAFLEDVSLVADVDTMKDQVDSVTLLTLHAAKGLEFPVVFIPGLEEGLFPHSRALDENELDEERRLCYVGITRAMKRLYLIYCERRTVYGLPRMNEPSRFLAALPQTTVRHMHSSGMSTSSLSLPGAVPAVRSWSGGATAIGGRGAAGAPGLGTGPRKSFGPITVPGTVPPGGNGGTGAPFGPQRGVSPVAPLAPTAPVAATYRAGQRVRHRAFGDGVVLESTITRRGEEEVRVRFDATGIKVLLGTLAPMEIL